MDVHFQRTVTNTTFSETFCRKCGKLSKQLPTLIPRLNLLIQLVYAKHFERIWGSTLLNTFHCRVDHSVNITWLQLWDQISYGSLYLLRNWLKGTGYCPFQDQHRSLSSALSGSPCWAGTGAEKHHWVSHFLSELEFSCLFLVFLTFLFFWEDNSTKILVPPTLFPASGPLCGLFFPYPLCFNVFPVSDWQVCQMELSVAPSLYAS